MKSVKVTAFNPSDPLSTIKIVEEPIPSPAEGQVLIRMSAMPVHPADYFSIMGVYPGFQPDALPATPGLEGCGVVAAFGPNTKAFFQNGRSVKVGARVIPNMLGVSTSGGAWVEYVVANVEDVVAVPRSVPDESCAQMLNPMTVIGMLDELEVPRGKYLLQSAGGSQLGKKLVQIAKERGIKTISTVRRCEQIDELKALGADEVICTSDGPDGVSDAVMEITDGDGAWAAVDPVAGDMTAILQEATRQGGTVLLYGALEGLDFRGSVVSSVFRDVTIKGYWVQAALLKEEDPRKRQKLMGEALKTVEIKNDLASQVGKRFLMDDVREAFMEANREGRSSDGKALLVTDPACAQDFSIRDEL